MKTLLFILSIVLCAVGCRENPEIIDALINHDRTLPKILTYRIEENSRLIVELDQVCELKQVKMRDITVEHSHIARLFEIELPFDLEMGVYENIGLTFEKAEGMIAKASLRVAGKNPNLPLLLLNEISIAGTKANPDKIELKVTEGGNTAGMIISDGLYGSERYTFHLPELEVDKGDLIVIYWDSSVSEEKKIRDYGCTWYLKGKSPTTIISTNGIIALLEEEDGNVMDAVLYTDQSNEEENPYGSEKLKAIAERVLEEELWRGKPLDSSTVTASRVFARLPGSDDTDSEDDWFVTAARKSTFGEENIYDPYLEE